MQFCELIGASRGDENMAACCARRALRLPSASPATLLSAYARPSSLPTNLGAFASVKPKRASLFSFEKVALSRIPAELGGALSLFPLHSATASALFTSLLSVTTDNWGCLSAEFATPL